jgi:tyrosine-protein kinase Srms
MAFLEKRHVVHRDLAARNVLVGKDLSVVKLSDLGATRVLGTFPFFFSFLFRGTR